MALLGGHPTMGWGPIPTAPIGSRCQERRLRSATRSRQATVPKQAAPRWKIIAT